MGPDDSIGWAGLRTFIVQPYGQTNLSPPFSSLLARSSFTSLQRLVYRPGYFAVCCASPFATRTNSLLRIPFPTNASLGCKYLQKDFLITESVLQLIPTCSSMALMLVWSLFSPPSDIMIKTAPPCSMQSRISYSSWAVKGNLGAPRRSKLHSLSFLQFSSLLLISHCANREQWHFKKDQ